MSEALAGYAAAAVDLRASYDALFPEQLYAPVCDVTPRRGETVLDIGAGTGRDAAFWHAQGCDVTAVEPVAALWAHSDLPVLHDTLPLLSKTRALGRRFDVIILTAVFHHLRPSARKLAFAALSDLLKPAGRVVMSLREGPTPPGRPGFAFAEDTEREGAASVCLNEVFRRAAPSLGAQNAAAGVRWCWVCYRKSER